MSTRRTTLFLILALGVLAGGLRFCRLGDWPFHGDELPTLQETASLFGEIDVPSDSQSARLPRLVPLSYTLHYLGYQLFGRDEFGSRVLIALLGTLNVLIVFIGLDRPLGRIPALATALLMALWPEHLFRSQENRFYMIASVCASLCMVLGAQAVYRRSLGVAAAASLAAIAAVLAHTLQGLLLGGLFTAFLAAAWVARDRRLGRLVVVSLAALVPALFLLVWHVLPLARSWNNGEQWGFGNLHSIMASISQLGWPITLLTLLGIIGACKRRGEQDSYWLAWAGLWASATLVLPFCVQYHPGYIFPLTLGALVLAGRAVAQIYEALQRQNVVAARAWLGLAVLLNLPGLVSHYVDGSCFDFRTSAHYVSAHWQPGDRVATASPTLLKHYLADGIEPLPVKGTDPVPKLRQLARDPGRLWIVFPSARSGKPEALREWLGRNCSQRLMLCKNRFDYYQNVTEVFLYEPHDSGPRWTRRDAEDFPHRILDSSFRARSQAPMDQ
jgi:hypothetical protein